MNEFFIRQVAVLRRIISDYRNETLSLNGLIQRIEGIGGVLDIDAWNEASCSIVMSMEQVNAVALYAKRGLTNADKTSIENSLLELEVLISRFENEWV